MDVKGNSQHRSFFLALHSSYVSERRIFINNKAPMHVAAELHDMHVPAELQDFRKGEDHGYVSFLQGATTLSLELGETWSLK